MNSKRSTLTSWASGLCVALLCAVPVHAQSQLSLRAGASRIDITPPDPSSVTNLFGHKFDGIHDRLFARALVLANGETSIAVVSLDVVGVGDTLGLRQDISRQLKIPADHIMIAATHSHSAPRVGIAAQGQVGPDDYTRFVFAKIVDAVRQAQTAMVPARLEVQAGRADVNVNRDLYTSAGWKLGFSPDGPSDKTVWVLKVESGSGQAIALLFNYSVHATVAGLQNNMISGDLAGAAETYVERHYGGEAVALWTMGAAGDQAPRFTADTGGSTKKEAVPAYEAMDAQGLMIGAEVVRVSNRMDRLTAEVHLSAQERIISCPAKNTVGEASNTFQQSGSVEIKLDVIVVNQIALAGVSSEVVSNVYTHLRKVSPLVNTILITLANDRTAYVADDAFYDTPIFEITRTPLARGCAENGVIDAIVEMATQEIAK